MKFNRQTVRLKTWDYRNPAYYFVTICTHQRQNLFEDTRLGDIAANGLLQLPQKTYAQHLVLDEWVVMPNHVHAVFIFTRLPARGTSTNTSHCLQNASPGSLGFVVGQYKRLVTIQVNQL